MSCRKISPKMKCVTPCVWKCLTARAVIDGRQQGDDFVGVRLQNAQERMRGILAAAPVENCLYPFHTLFFASGANPPSRPFVRERNFPIREDGLRRRGDAFRAANRGEGLPMGGEIAAETLCNIFHRAVGSHSVEPLVGRGRGERPCLLDPRPEFDVVECPGV